MKNLERKTFVVTAKYNSDHFGFSKKVKGEGKFMARWRLPLNVSPEDTLPKLLNTTFDYIPRL